MGSIDEIPLGDVRDCFRALRRPTTVDLHDVSVHYRSSDPIHVTDVRLRLDRVSACWPAKAQGVNVNYVWGETPPDHEPAPRR